MLATLTALAILTLAAICAVAYPIALLLHAVILAVQDAREEKRLRALQEKRFAERRAARWSAF